MHLSPRGNFLDRWTELSITSELCKNLFNGNISLKMKHEALLARLPPGSSLTPTTTPSSSVAPTPHYYTSSLPRAIPAPRRHTRRISVSPSDIALLSDQNAELLSKIEKLEAESTHADQAGKRQLGKLEKEIQVLRDELEAARVHSQELEEQAKLGAKAEKGSDEAAKKRQEREERAKALRGKSEVDKDNMEDLVRDFAPPGGLAISKTRPSSVCDAPPPLAASILSAERFAPSSISSILSSSISQSPASPTSAPPEYALISQLLQKIRELEQTNQKISEQQAATAVKLREAQADAETIGKIYACLGEETDVELEVVEDDEAFLASPQSGLSDSTVRFKSLRRSIDRDLNRLIIDGGLDNVTDEFVHSTLQNGAALKSIPTHKLRRSVVGLFDRTSPRSEFAAQSSTASSTSSPLLRHESFPTWSATNSVASSPVLSSLDLLTSDFASGPRRHPTLGSELGSEYGEDVAAQADNHHLRSSSLYDLTRSTPEPSPSPSPTDEPLNLWEDDTPLSSAGHRTVGRPSPWHTTSGRSTPSPSDPPKTLRRPASIRNQLLSQTVRARTHRWVDRRFRENLESFRQEEEAAGGDETRSISGASTVTRVFDVVDAVMEKFVGAVSVESDIDGKTSPREISAGKPQSSSLYASKGKTQGFASLMLQLWLWLQFSIIVLVFLWAMAKKGPRSVLEEAERKRAASRH